MASPHDYPLISTVAVGLSLAFICGFIASKLRLPPIFGYLIAGIIVGPYTPGFTADIELAEQLAEIGVVLLLFGVGLHFSLQDFKEVRRIASAGAVVCISLVTISGIGLAHLWGWPISSGIIYGLSLSVASTVVLLRTLEQYHMLQSLSGKIGIGWLILEDIVLILALILIPSLAAADMIEKPGTAAAPNWIDTVIIPLVVAIGKVTLFAALMFVIGRRVLPWLLSAVSRTGSRELFTLAVFAMAMGTAFGAATLFGVSFALGAFFAGMMIRESDLNHEVADRALPFQDAFAVLFFIAIGMLFDPSIMLSEPLKIAVTVLIIIGMKFAITVGLMRLFRYPQKTGLMVAAGLAQIGEFSFILIALGASVGMLNEEARNLILGGALISIAANPMLFGLCFKHTLSLEEIPDKEDMLAHLEEEEGAALNDLVILTGYDKVGSGVAEALKNQNVDLIIIDRNRERIEALRGSGYHALAGDAISVETLEEAQIHKALAIVVSVADPFEARQIVDISRALNPRIRVVVHAHNEEEEQYFRDNNIKMVVMDSRAVARSMVANLNELRANIRIRPPSTAHLTAPNPSSV